jgi:hypothetical protein
MLENKGSQQILTIAKNTKKTVSRKNTKDKNDNIKNLRYELTDDRIMNTNDEKISNLKSEPMFFYRNKTKNYVEKKKENSTTEMVTCSLDNNEKTTDSRSFFTNLQLKSKTNKSRSCIKLSKVKYFDKTNLKKKKIKKVSFKKKFISYIDVESYKKYYMEDFGFNAKDKVQTKCTCLIF